MWATRRDHMIEAPDPTYVEHAPYTLPTYLEMYTYIYIRGVLEKFWAWAFISTNVGLNRK